VEPSLVESLPLAERERLERVVVVRYDSELCVDRFAVDREAERLTVPGGEKERTKPGERVPPAPVPLAAVDEECIDAQGDVVQEDSAAYAADVDAPLGPAEGGEGTDGVVSVETDIAGEVVPSPEGNADERKIPLDRDLGDGRERAVASCNPESRSLRGAGELCGIVVFREDARLDPAPARLLAELFGGRLAVPRAGIDEEVPGQTGTLRVG
jgi:hypothetical protein